MALPDLDALLALERQGRRQGTGLTAPDLVGCWVLRQVWPQAGRRPLPLAAALLRSLGARLEIAPGDVSGGLRLVNAVRLGGLELRFVGEGELGGGRPLLRFRFDRWQLGPAARPWLNQPLPSPDARQGPFFALIGTGATEGGGRWLAARGRGGGLALWEVASAPKARLSGDGDNA